MLSLILAAALAQAAPAPAPAPAPADEWRVFTANPAYEVYGHMDGGVFRYTKNRPKVAPAKVAPAKNFGVNLPKEPVMCANDFEVTGSDKALGRSIAEAAIAPAPAGPCPGPGPCPAPDRTPRPDLPRPHVPPPLPPTLERDALIVVGAVALVAIAGFAVLALVLTTIVVALRALWRHLTSPAHDVV